MTRLLKTTNKQHAEEKFKYYQDGLRVETYGDTIHLREFPDGSGQVWYEIWLDHNKESCRKA